MKEIRVVTIASPRIVRLVLAAALLATLPLSGVAQDRLKTMPGYDQYQRMSPLMTAQALRLATPAANWTSDGKAIEYEDANGKWHTETASGSDRPETEVKVLPLCSIVPWL